MGSLHEVRCEKLGKTYDQGAPALRDLNLAFAAGAITGVLGANGAGKSTLVGLLAGSVRPTSGAVKLVEQGGAELPFDRGRVGLIAHATLLYADLSARENLRFYARLYGVEDARVDEVIDRCGLARYKDRPTRTYSRGMAQRTAIARAILHRPDLLLG